MRIWLFLRNRPWILIVIAFLILIVSWVALFRIAKEHAPEPIRPETPEAYDNAGS